MAPPYKLTYFELTGLAESIRLLFHYGGIDFVDVRISQSEWPKLKESMPLGQLPVLEYNGKVMYQSVAIARYVAKQVGLAGDNDLEAYDIDSAVDTVNDLRLSIAQYLYEKDPIRKQEMKTTLDTVRLPFLLSRIESWTKDNNGYLTAGKLTWADFYFYSVTGYLKNYFGRDFLEGYPALQALRETVYAIPAIKRWVDHRPADNFKPM